MVKGTLSHPSPTPPSLPLCLLFAIRLPGAGCEVPNDLSPKINPISPHVPSCGCLGSLGVEGWGQTDGHGGGWGTGHPAAGKGALSGRPRGPVLWGLQRREDNNLAFFRT